MTCSFTFSRSCTFPTAGGPVYVKHSCEVLSTLISDLTAQNLCLLLHGWGSTRPTLKSFLALSKALSGPCNSWQERVCSQVADYSSFPTILVRIISERAAGVLPLQLQARHCLAGTFSLIFWLKQGLKYFSGILHTLKQLETFSWQIV